MNWLVKDDLSELKKLPESWTALNRLIREEGFPPGRIIGRNRIWLEQEVDDWLLSRSTAKCRLRGRARQLAERPPEILKSGPSAATEEPGPRCFSGNQSNSGNTRLEPDPQPSANGRGR